MLGTTGSFLNSSSPVVARAPFVFSFVLGSPADVATFQQAWGAADDEAIGQLLGIRAVAGRSSGRCGSTKV
jgi:hypothetical protein